MSPTPHDASAPTVAVLHGPNLNLLGQREPSLYGGKTLDELDAELVAAGEALGLVVWCRQANGEGALVDGIQEAGCTAQGLVINPAGYTHTSVAILDALRSVPIPAIEVHLTNLYAREPFRAVSRTAAGCIGVVMGLGTSGYHLALRHLASRLVVSSP